MDEHERVEETARSGYGCGSSQGAVPCSAPAPAGWPADNFAVGNGRIEATEIDIATKAAGRITAILVNDGDVVEAGQVVAQMDTQTLEAELRQAQAQVRQRSRPAPYRHRSPTRQCEGHGYRCRGRESAKATAAAVVAQRQSELAHWTELTVHSNWPSKALAHSSS